MEHHPIFAKFPGYDGDSLPGYDVDYIGFHASGDWEARALHIRGNLAIPVPSLNEEYFEWIDLLEAVDSARGTFTMVELGAGYGRWGIRGAVAARKRGLKPRVRFVEAEPQHVAWLREAMAVNSVDGEVLEAAVAYDGEPVPFTVGGDNQSAANWYGQSIVRWPTVETDRLYFGKPIYRSRLYDHILAPAITLEDACAGLGPIDLIDADIQGAEGEMVAKSIAFLNEHVRRVHIGTHGPEIEDTIRETFSAAGWRCVWDFKVQQVNDTPYGECKFGDGIAGWINPRLT